MIQTDIDNEVYDVLKGVNFNAYEEFVVKNWGGTEDIKIDDVILAVLGLVGESGEVADAVKKVYRDGFTPENIRESWGKPERVMHKQEIAKELGDVLFYLTKTAQEFGLTISYIAALNAKKLLTRKFEKKGD